MAKHISRNYFVDISITLGQKRLFRQMGYNLFAKVAILPKGYYFCAKGEAEGDERRGKRTLPADWYYFRTKPNQPFPWVISNRIYLKRVMSHAEVETICWEHGVEAQKLEE